MKEMDGEEQNFICNFIPNESNGAKSFVNKIKTQNSISINFDLTISGGHIDDVIAQSFPDLEIVGDTTAKPQIGQLSYTSEWKDLCLCGEIPGGYIFSFKTLLFSSVASNKRSLSKTFDLNELEESNECTFNTENSIVN